MKYLIIMIASFLTASVCFAQTSGSENLAQIICLTRGVGPNPSSLGQAFVFTQAPGTGIDGNTLVNPDSEEYKNVIVTPDIDFRMQHYIVAPALINRYVKLNQSLATQEEELNRLIDELSETFTDRAPAHLIQVQRQLDGIGIGNFTEKLGDGIDLNLADMSGFVTYNNSASPLLCFATTISHTPSSLDLNEESLPNENLDSPVAN